MISFSQKMDGNPRIISINVSAGGIPKQPVERIEVTSLGLAGDGHNHEKHNSPLQAVCLQDIEELEGLCRQGYVLSPGATGENLTLRQVFVNGLAVGTVLAFDGGVAIELTKVRKPCYVLDAIHRQLKEDIIGRCGYYARVLQEGLLTAGEKISIVRKK